MPTLTPTTPRTVTPVSVQAPTGRRPRRRQPWRRRLLLAIVTSLATVVGAAGWAAPAVAYPPTPPPTAEAEELLAGLTVAPENSGAGYDRDLFPHWSSQGDSCNTREVVLRRDGEGVEVDGECYPSSGRWYSVYDATWVEDPADVQIDHIVALAEAWRSGADEWTTAEREVFANDLTHAQLIAVSGVSNGEKSDDDPAEWMPANESTWCFYAREWVWVKSVYDLSADQAEHDALADTLAGC